MHQSIKEELPESWHIPGGNFGQIPGFKGLVQPIMLMVCTILVTTMGIGHIEQALYWARDEHHIKDPKLIPPPPPPNTGQVVG